MVVPGMDVPVSTRPDAHREVAHRHVLVDLDADLDADLDGTGRAHSEQGHRAERPSGRPPAL